MGFEDRMTEEHIKRYINFHATSAVESRGRQLFNNGSVEFTTYTEKTDSWEFAVQGSMKYRVLVKGVNRHNIQTSCTCPFEWGSLCKHAAATLLFVSDNLGNQSQLIFEKGTRISMPAKLLPTKRIRNKAGYELNEYKKITQEFIRKNTSTRIMGQLLYLNSSFSYKRIEISNNSVAFIASNNNPDITFYSEKAKVYVTSHGAANSEQLTLYEAHCLNSIAVSPIPNLLDEVFSRRVIEKEKEMLNSYGLQESTEFKDYFFYIFSEEYGLTYVQTKKAHGLVPVSNINDNNYLNLIHEINNDVLLLNKLSRKKEERTMGFVIRKKSAYYDDYGDYYEEGEGYEIVAIVGKTNKSGTIFSAHIKEYDEFINGIFQVQKSENSKKTLELIKRIDNEDNEEVEFQLLKKAFNYLVEEKFVFGLKEDSHEIKKKNLEKITLSPEPVDIVFDVSKNTEFLILKMNFKIGDTIFRRKKGSMTISDNCFHEVDGIHHFVKDYKVAQYISQYPDNLKMVLAHKHDFFKNVIEPVSKNFEIQYKRGTFTNDSVELDFNKKQLFLSEQNEHVVFTPQVVYDNGVSAILNTSGNILSKNGDNITEYKRNFELEDDFIELLAGLHPNFETQKSKKLFYLHYSEFAENMWFYKFFDQLQTNNIEVYGLKDLKNFKYSPYKGKISTSISSGQDWFEVDIKVSFGDNRVNLSDIKKAVINKQRYIQLKDGSVGVLPSDWFHKLEKYFRNGEVKKDKLEISKLRFSVVDELFDNIDDAEIIEEVSEKRKRLTSLTEIKDVKVPTQIKADLRHYQKEGLNWLHFLDEMQWGGILADDMGLGKTLQVLTFLQHQANTQKACSLIVVPTTLLFNWENEIKKFAPKLKALYYYGTDRVKDTAHFKDYHLIFTTYGILLRDIELLCKFEFNYVILDESQAIKNPASRRYKAANLINAKNRIALTGTPIENGTFDLFAQMNFANRGFFGAAKSFKENYSNPIDKDGNEVIAGELHRIINPFILRRTKEKVASELPAKTEDVIYCEMETEQRKIYDAYRNEYRNQLLNKIEDDGIGKSKMMVLEALTRLRQICDSPVLLNSEEIKETQSIKIKEIVRHITDKTGNHKILVFSQFVKMLAIIKDELSKLNIDYEYLDGQSSTKQREQSVNNFQENDNLRVFLISLKAGGTGLNLTAADYVYIVDPWWNPAVENQAIDRCYRIGQDKKVFAYRMICKNTVEEKIVNLQNKKKKIAGDIIQTDENIMKKLNTNDIKELFS